MAAFMVGTPLIQLATAAGAVIIGQWPRSTSPVLRQRWIGMDARMLSTGRAPVARVRHQLVGQRRGRRGGRGQQLVAGGGGHQPLCAAMAAARQRPARRRRRRPTPLPRQVRRRRSAGAGDHRVEAATATSPARTTSARRASRPPVPTPGRGGERRPWPAACPDHRLAATRKRSGAIASLPRWAATSRHTARGPCPGTSTVVIAVPSSSPQCAAMKSTPCGRERQAQLARTVGVAPSRSRQSRVRCEWSVPSSSADGGLVTHPTPHTAPATDAELRPAAAPRCGEPPLGGPCGLVDLAATKQLFDCVVVAQAAGRDGFLDPSVHVDGIAGRCQSQFVGWTTASGVRIRCGKEPRWQPDRRPSDTSAQSTTVAWLTAPNTTTCPSPSQASSSPRAVG